ncbi:unnamed protein product [Eruca vesicaria subsp. sativa]|uniref:Uncharacterized protein n=1 Tax=Eruca vesicaria subsp. sativa TaxID=29727 RepID=A0ABC8KX61_ERUVS|nr:unnamed protein product [Eruca vesicaria subsp. sativa]
MGSAFRIWSSVAADGGEAELSLSSGLFVDAPPFAIGVASNSHMMDPSFGSRRWAFGDGFWLVGLSPPLVSPSMAPYVRVAFPSTGVCP